MTGSSGQSATLQSDTAATEGMDKLVGGILLLVLMAGAAIQALNQNLASIVENAEWQHLRGEKLRAYQRRRSWKKSDIPALKTLDVNKTAQRCMERLTGTGRPVVKGHQPLGLVIENKLRAFELFSPDASPQQRKKAVRLWPYWKHNVEALHRGEHALAKQNGIVGPSGYAEAKVAEELAISMATVHAICGEIRRIRREKRDDANFPPMTLTEFRSWMETGKDPYEEPN